MPITMAEKIICNQAFLAKPSTTLVGTISRKTLPIGGGGVTVISLISAGRGMLNPIGTATKRAIMIASAVVAMKSPIAVPNILPNFAPVMPAIPTAKVKKIIGATMNISSRSNKSPKGLMTAIGGPTISPTIIPTTKPMKIQDVSDIFFNTAIFSS